MMIKRVVRFQNDFVMAFDESGKQLADYQGQYAEVKSSILKDATEETIFANANWRTGEMEDIDKERF